MHVSDPSLGLEEAAQAADGDESDEQLKQRALEQAKQAVLKNQQRTQQFDQKVGHAATDDSDQVCLLSFLPALLPSFFLSWVCLPVGVAFFFFFFFFGGFWNATETNGTPWLFGCRVLRARALMCVEPESGAV